MRGKEAEEEEEEKESAMPRARAGMDKANPIQVTLLSVFCIALAGVLFDSTQVKFSSVLFFGRKLFTLGSVLLYLVVCIYNLTVLSITLT